MEKFKFKTIPSFQLSMEKNYIYTQFSLFFPFTGQMKYLIGKKEDSLVLYNRNPLEKIFYKLLDFLNTKVKTLKIKIN